VPLSILFFNINARFGYLINIFFDRANIVSHASSYAQQHGNSISTNQAEIVDQMQLKVNELCMKIDELEHELNFKTGTVDRKLRKKIYKLFCLLCGTYWM
jgi:hypothetical protein